MDAPKIATAIPKRRYQIGEYGAVILGEVESRDERRYKFVFALTRDGDSAPCLFVTSEQNPPAEQADGAFRLRVVAENGEKILGSSDGLADLDNFSTVSVGIAKQLFQLDDEQETRLL